MNHEAAAAELDRRARIVEAPNGLWHIRPRESDRAYCGEAAADFPIVIRWAERSGMTCGLCLIGAGLLPARRSSRRG